MYIEFYGETAQEASEDSHHLAWPGGAQLHSLVLQFDEVYPRLVSLSHMT